MKSTAQRLTALAAAFCFLFLAGHTLPAADISKSFKNVKSITIKTVSGDCIVKRGSGDEVKVVVSYTFDEDAFQPVLDQRGTRLVLEERFRSTRWDRGHSGQSSWDITVPDQVEVSFSTASGNLEMSGLNAPEIDASSASGRMRLSSLKGIVSASTASGDIDASGLDGEIKLSAASGNIDVSSSKGTIRVSTASGRIDAKQVDGDLRFSAASGSIRGDGVSGEMRVSAASGDLDLRGVVIKRRSSFSAASGDVELVLGASPADDLRASAASGDVDVSYGGHDIKGYIEMTARAGGNRISAPFNFDREETYFRDGREYVTKIAERGSGPTIELNSASGRVALKK